MADKNKIYYCTLLQNGLRPACSRKLEECEKCGWNPTVQAERKAWLNLNGLTLCEDGLKRLIMPKKKKNKYARLFTGGL